MESIKHIALSKLFLILLDWLQMNTDTGINMKVSSILLLEALVAH